MIEGKSKDMKLASIINDSNSCGSNSEQDKQIEDLTPNVVNERKRFLNPPKRKPPTPFKYSKNSIFVKTR